MKARLSVRLSVDYTIHHPWEDPHIRIFGKWTNCVTTEAMKEGATSWAIEGDSPRNSNDKKGAQTLPLVRLADRQTVVVGTWSQEINIQLTSEEEISRFNTCPYLTAVLLTCCEKNLQMLTFASLDCSALLMSGGSVSCRSPCREGVFVDLKLESAEPLLPQNKLISFEPLELNLHRLLPFVYLSVYLSLSLSLCLSLSLAMPSPLHSFDSFPSEPNVPPVETLKSAYIFGSFDFGEGFERMIFGYPLGDQCTSNSNPTSISTSQEISQIFLPVDYRTCILTAMAEKLRFQDHLTSSTFILQIHTDEICDRIFSSVNQATYNEKYIHAPHTLVAPAAVEVDPKTKQPSPRGKKNNKSAPAPVAASGAAAVVSSNSLIHPTQGEVFQEKDEMVWSWITSALKNSPKLLSYGSVRCRLDSVLNTSTDRLLDFQSLQTQQKNSDSTVVISVSFSLYSLSLLTPSLHSPILLSSLSRLLHLTSHHRTKRC
jgi:hypothetical protein